MNQISKIVIATRNSGKLREFQNLLAGLPISLSDLSEYSHIPEIIEDGVTFEENARKKARVVAKQTQTWTLADDSGLEVRALNGRPGVFSARYAGPKASDLENCQKLIAELQGIAEPRLANFRCVLVLCHPDGREFKAEGKLEGRILDQLKGERGFGYDPLFVPLGSEKTLAELAPEEKNRISHRGKALSAIVEKIRQILG